MSELQDFNAFPNAPGLSQDLGLQRREDGAVPPKYDERGWMWYSLCSAHREPHKGCAQCAVGSYHPQQIREEGR